MLPPVPGAWLAPATATATSTATTVTTVSCVSPSACLRPRRMVAGQGHRDAHSVSVAHSSRNRCERYTCPVARSARSRRCGCSSSSVRPAAGAPRRPRGVAGAVSSGTSHPRSPAKPQHPHRAGPPPPRRRRAPARSRSGVRFIFTSEHTGWRTMRSRRRGRSARQQRSAANSTPSRMASAFNRGWFTGSGRGAGPEAVGARAGVDTIGNTSTVRPRQNGSTVCSPPPGAPRRSPSRRRARRSSALDVVRESGGLPARAASRVRGCGQAWSLRLAGERAKRARQAGREVDGGGIRGFPAVDSPGRGAGIGASHSGVRAA